MTIFEKIINKEIPANIIYENKKVIAILDLHPKTTGHTLVIPKIFSRNLIDINNQDLQTLIIEAKIVATKLIKKIGVDGFKLQINNEASSGQEIFHTHIHIIPTKSDKKISPSELDLRD